MISSNLGHRRNRSYRVWLSCAVLLVVVAAAAVWRTPLHNAFVSAVSPLFAVRFAPGTPAIAESARAADRDALYQENLDLKARLGRTVSVSRVLAGVLLRPPATPYDTLTIDAGSGEGVVQGDKVAAGGTVLIGTVSEVAAHSAQVILYSSPGQKYDALLHLSNGTTLSLGVVGVGGGSLTAQVPAGTQVVAGDHVSLPGVVGGLMAEVSGVQSASGESFATIYLTLPVNPDQLQFVEVWK